jgi:hypothetical protein
MVGKEGAWMGYFYPAIAAGAVLFADGVGRLDIVASMPPKERLASVVVILMLVGQLWMFAFWVPQPQKPLSSQYAVHDYLEGQQGRVLAEEPSLVPDKRQPPVDPLLAKGLVRSGYFDDDIVANRLRCGYWRHVVTWIRARPETADKSRFTAAQIEAIHEHYVRVDSVTSSWHIYRYDGKPACEAG